MKLPITDDPRFSHVFNYIGHGPSSQNARIVTNVIEDLADCWQDTDGPVTLDLRTKDIDEIIFSLKAFRDNAKLIEKPLAEQYIIKFPGGKSVGPFFDREKAIITGYNLAHSHEYMGNGAPATYTVEQSK